MNSPWIDISVPLRSGMVHWPGDAGVRIERTLAIERGDSMNLSTVSMCLHSGTHMDAPLHFLARAPGLDRMPLTATVGRARVIEFPGAAPIGRVELEPHAIRFGERILLKTSNSRRCWSTDDFIPDYVCVSQDGAQYLAERRIQALGIDYLSIGAPGPEGEETHRILMTAGIWIIEGLNLSAVEPGDYELICLPLKVLDADGAPARAIVRRSESNSSRVDNSQICE
jgi:arylformamidase